MMRMFFLFVVASYCSIMFLQLTQIKEREGEYQTKMQRKTKDGESGGEYN